MPKTFRVAVYGRTGKGNYGHQVDQCWLDIPRTEVVAVADEDATGRARASERLNVQQTFADYREMLDQVRPDIIAVAPRWIDMHFQVAMEAVRRGVHVYMEKPFVRTLAEADELITAAQMRHVQIAVAYPTRYSPLVSTIRRLLDNGAIGDVLELRARGKEDRRGGAEDLWVLGCHMFDLILALGFHPQWCFASVMAAGRPVEREDVVDGNEGIGPLAGDTIQALYGMAEGCTATFQSHRDTGEKLSRYGLQIYGSQGVIEILEGTLPAVHILQDPSWSPGRSGRHWKPVSSAGIGKPEPLTAAKYRQRHTLAIEDLLDAIDKHREPRSSAEEARRSLEMIAAVFESHRLKKPVNFPLETRVNPLTLL